MVDQWWTLEGSAQGTTYVDFKPLPGAKEMFSHLVDSGRHIVFISNNSSMSASTYRKKLSEILEIEVSQDQVHTSSLATIQFLISRKISRVYALGTPEFEQELVDHGIEITENEPQMIVVAFDKTLTYEKLKNACLMILDGVDYIATHPDNVCPTLEGYIPDAGSFIALIETATGKKPRHILGKPDPALVKTLLEKLSIGPEKAIIFGDRIYTDMLMGKNAGIGTALMLTGESSIGDIGKFGIFPDLVFRDLNEALELLKRITP
jgi:HAD superfamily hydrolase (TIGR01450 family)